MDQVPLILAGNGIFVTFAQEANFVGLLQRVQIRWIRAKFLVIQLDRAHILLAAMNQLHLPVPLNIRSHLRRGNRQHNQHHHHQKQDRQQDIAFLATQFAGGLRILAQRQAPARSLDRFVAGLGGQFRSSGQFPLQHRNAQFAISGRVWVLL